MELAIQEGYTHFISGFARGADLLFAQAVAAQKDKGAKLVLEAAIPYRGRLYSREEGFQQLLGRCDRITVVSEEYFPGCYMRRNRYIWACSALSIKKSNFIDDSPKNICHYFT